MKKLILLALAVCTLLPGAVAAKKPVAKKDTTIFTVVKQLPITSIKDQNQSGTCWAYASMAFFEAELLRMGKGEHELCVPYLVYHTYMDRADKYVRTHASTSFAQGGSFHDGMYCLKHYGIVPASAMPAPGTLYGDSLFNFNQFFPVATAYMDAIAKGKLTKVSPVWKKDLSHILTDYLGVPPKEVKAEDGKTYTPKQYVTDYLGLNMDDYVSLTSFSHQPFYEPFALEIPDNWRWGLSYNVPLDELMRTMEHAVETGYPVAWAADVSEVYFGRRNGKGYAYVPKDLKVRDLTGSDAAKWSGTDAMDKGATVSSDEELPITQELRQEAYDNWETTDDHAMLIYGLAKDQRGTEYFMVKNSWGDYGKYHGMFYASKAYAAYKTINIVINKKALPADIAKKLGL